ncbi:hypothetical protein TIFTF001_041787 [Ficus carica]|uniref:Sulfotransferase n=1 Tax=Ficus carica TaxID=3494 RepID=A0AA87ZIQ9_FICCA|nr:hypothetical protein TIFTF001_041787 [Ficus carica]
MSKVKEVDDEFEAILENLEPNEKELINGKPYYYHQGFWIAEFLFRSTISAQRNFVAHEDDIILASCPKSGTTWLKALVFSIVNRTRFAPTDSPLLKVNPHDLVPFLESPSRIFEKIVFDQPRLFSTHMPHQLLSLSIKTSDSKIVYISRNPMDQFISYWFYTCKFPNDPNAEPVDLEDFFDKFCRGIHNSGPFWDHVLGYWKASLERPHKILFLKYEELKKDIGFNIKRLAKFLGFPFSEEEERRGVVEEISTLCSFEKMKNFDVNKNGHWTLGISNSLFFRKGEVGDWKNFLTPSMVERMEKLLQEKFGEHNLTFELPDL